MNMMPGNLQNTYIRLLDLLICVPFLIIPLFPELPYRVNIYLSWEGAYRLSIGQTPFADFGLPMGFGYWLIPALFFKLFGPSLYTLVKAQILINAISLLSLRGILYRLRLKPLLISAALLVFCLTYVIFNFWPWYNHAVVVFELAAIYFAVRYLTRPDQRFAFVSIFLSGSLAFLSFFTKQDAGALCFVICCALFGYHALISKKYLPLLSFALSFIGVGLLTVVPFFRYDFLYWFNYGQPPHNPRVGIVPLADAFFFQAIWEKIYLSLFAVLLIVGGKRKLMTITHDRNLAMLALITLGLIGQAIITRVSSPLPTDHMTYFHAFAIAALVSFTGLYHRMERFKTFALVGTVMVLTFSSGYWRYVKGILGMSVSREDATIPRRKDPWINGPFRGFEKVLMPQETVAGISDLLALEIAQKDHLKVLNMSELTPLALEMGYVPPTDQPLWYHLNIGMFQKEVDMFCDRVRNEEYDLVLFQDIPGLVHFFPYEVRDTLRAHYRLQDTFLAPRKLENSVIEVYVRK